MTISRSAPAAAIVFALLLAACGRATADVSSPTPAPSTPVPTVAPAPSEGPEAPSEEPAPSERPIVTPGPSEPVGLDADELAILARSTADAVNVRSLPDLQGPLHVGHRAGTDDVVRDVQLFAGDLVLVTMGPVVADGHAWYEVTRSGDHDVSFVDGWVSGRYLEREDALNGIDPVFASIDGKGSGAAVSVDVPADAPLTVRFAAGPVDGRRTCDIDVTLIRTDGAAVNVATQTMTGTQVHHLASFQLPSLYQEEAGTVTLRVTTDCTFAATVSIPQG